MRASLSAGLGAGRMEFEKTLAQREEVTCLRPQALAVELGFEPGPAVAKGSANSK